MAAGLRLGAPLVRPHSCICGGQVDSLGLHGLSCKRSAGRQRRHVQANGVLARAFRAAEVTVELEPRHLLTNNDKRPDGATVDLWRRGKALVWDFTCPDTLAASYIASSASRPGAAAARAEHNKRAKYSQLLSSGEHQFYPVAIETLGTWGESAAELCKDLGALLAQITGDPRSHQFLKQRLGLAVQRGNAASVAGTFPSGDSVHQL